MFIGSSARTSTIHYMSANLNSRAETSDPFWSLAHTTAMTIGLLAAIGGGYGELRGVDGYRRQSVAQWSLTSAGEVANRFEVAFPISPHEAQATNIMLYAGEDTLAGGRLERSGMSPALPGQGRIVFKPGALRVKVW